MAHEKVKATVVFMAIIAIVGGISWALVSAQQGAQESDQTDQTNPPPQTMPKLTIREDICDAAMTYIKDNHPETAQFMSNLAWTENKQETGLLGAETYIYVSGDWQVTINYPVIPNPTYEVTVNYSLTPESGTVSIPFAIAWSGTVTDWQVTETSYTFAQ
jgi:hypothetical protein